MRLNTKMRYGTRAMLELALHHQDGPLSMSEIASRQGLSEKYLESLLGQLRTAGLIRAVRGSRGGYLLARSPEEITLRDIFDVLEGPEAFVPCTDRHESCDRSSSCLTRDVWAQMYEAAMSVLESHTLSRLVSRHQSPADSAPIYEI
ncbi:MAG TPA: Rrf2 family transcriptional regulator [Chloroflexi bacterium]|jgi:Rrf2 family protein|nr:Rrf2 family transcriptional regulator [Chloroflexota bacterium]